MRAACHRNNSKHFTFVMCGQLSATIDDSAMCQLFFLLHPQHRQPKSPRNLCDMLRLQMTRQIFYCLGK